MILLSILAGLLLLVGGIAVGPTIIKPIPSARPFMLVPIAVNTVLLLVGLLL